MEAGQQAVGSDHFGNELSRLTEIGWREMSLVAHQGAQQTVTVGDAENLVHRVTQDHPPLRFVFKQFNTQLLDVAGAIQSWSCHSRCHQITRSEVIEQEDLGDHCGFIGLDLPFLRSEFCQQPDLFLIRADLTLFGNRRKQSLQQ